MYLTDEDLEEWIALWKEEFNEVITREQARPRAMEIVELYGRLAQKPPSPADTSLKVYEAVGRVEALQPRRTLDGIIAPRKQR